MCRRYFDRIFEIKEDFFEHSFSQEFEALANKSEFVVISF